MARVTVITTVRNAGEFVGRCVASVLGQRGSDRDPDWEMIIVDDGSTDDTCDVVGSFDDERIRTIPSPPIGRAMALNRAVAEAAGEYLAVLDADDVSLPFRHVRQSAFLDANPEMVWVGARWVPRIDASDSLIGLVDMGCRTPDEVAAALIRGVVPAHHSTVMIRRSAVLACGGYDTTLPCGLDHDMLVRLLAHGQAANLDEPVTLKRNHRHQYFWGPEGVARIRRNRYRYKRRVQQHAVRVLGAPRLSAWTIPVRSCLPGWARRALRPIAGRRRQEGSQASLLRVYGREEAEQKLADLGMAFTCTEAEVLLDQRYDDPAARTDGAP